MLCVLRKKREKVTETEELNGYRKRIDKSKKKIKIVRDKEKKICIFHNLLILCRSKQVQKYSKI